MLEIWKLEIWYISTHAFRVLQEIPYSTKTPLIFLNLAVFHANIQPILGKNNI